MMVTPNRHTNLKSKIGVMERKPIALVTGATSGIGEACARKFLQNGYRVIVNGRNHSKVNLLMQSLGQLQSQAIALIADVSNQQALSQAYELLPAEWREIDVLVNNAGLALGLEAEYAGDLQDWDTMIDTNIKGLLYVTRLVVPGMVQRGYGHVVNIGSVAGDAAYAGGNVYCATKAAVKALSDGLRIDVAHTAVKVTNIKPGLVETNFSVTRFHGDEQRAAHVYQGIEPLTGADIADSVYFAVSAPKHVQIAEILILATHQANGTVVSREQQ